MIAPWIICCLAPAATLVQSEPERLIEEGHWKQARAIVEPWSHSKPNDALTDFLLSQIRNAFGDRQSPLPLAEKAVQLDAGTAKFHRQLAEALGVAAQTSNVFQQVFLARRFRKEIDIDLSEDPRDLQGLRDLMEYYLLAPGIAGGDKNQARAVADRIEHIDFVAGCLAKARLAKFFKEPDQVEVILRKAVEARPDSYRARIALANYYLHKNDGAAEQQAREAVKLDRGRVDAYAILAAIYGTRGDWTNLDAILATAEQAVPDDLTPDYRAAEAILAAHKDAARAGQYLRRYLAAEAEGNAPTQADARRLLEGIRL